MTVPSTGKLVPRRLATDPKRLGVSLKHRINLDQLRADLQTVSDRVVECRLRAILDVCTSDRSFLETCNRHKCSERTLRSWVSSYCKDGRTALQDRRRLTTAKLLIEHRAELQNWILNHPSGRQPTTREIRDHLEQEYDVHYESLQSVRRLIERLGLTRKYFARVPPQKER